ncbi:hypothetical protein D2S45_07120 [Prevotella intermedia]|uniref:Uncharacterized protein n=1 Tax=Prevotella intermedia TaxID=28131 RepID=A0A3R7YLK1_PREIN|nr:hypothetical protein D2S53_06880 [Prevotella intermedia]RRF87262.1 hypothetical protein D2S45_07120 [Prevotella intermedia]
MKHPNKQLIVQEKSFQILKEPLSLCESGSFTQQKLLFCNARHTLSQANSTLYVIFIGCFANTIFPFHCTNITHTNINS